MKTIRKMKAFPKFIMIVLIVIITCYAGYGLFNVGFFGNYLYNAPVMFVILLLLFLALAWFAVKSIKWILTLGLLLFITQSCHYAKSNQQVLISDDCGMSWKQINAGESVPRSGVNPCYMKVVVPNFPMQGEAKFIANLKDRVRASTLIDYDYSIVKPLAFIKQAKYLGKANTNADDSDAVDPKAFEGAENMVIDKRIKDVSKDIFLSEDIIELDQSDLEEKLLVESNKALEPFGVQLNFITLTFDLDEQTRQAIDVCTAMKIYASKGLGPIGGDVIISRAGAPKLLFENKVTQTPTE